MQKYLKDVIYEDLIKRKFLNPRQHGFRAGEGSEEAITVMIKYWKEVTSKAIDELERRSMVAMSFSSISRRLLIEYGQKEFYTI